MRYLPVLVAFLIQSTLFAQNSVVSGIVSNEEGEPIPDVTISLRDSTKGTTTDEAGAFRLAFSGSQTLIFRHISYANRQIDVRPDSSEIILNVVLLEENQQLSDVEISGEQSKEQVTPVQRIDPKSSRRLPSTFGDFNKILVTLPGVSSNNELSSAYSVRGGNFDENLVYVNDIPVYRPFLSNAGRQEGLSFINPDLVQDIEFYAGGWEAKYGDKLSSSLNIEYKQPDSLEAAVTLGLLGGTAYTGGGSERVSYLFGVRHRDSRYLLGSLEVSGQYFPTYTDVQSLLTFDLTKKSLDYFNKTKLNILLSYGRNRYLTKPESQLTEFGSVVQNFRLQTAFEGSEILRYDTYQAGARLSHQFTDRFRTHIIGSGLLTQEKEQFDVEGAYRLCDVNTNPGSSSFDDCVIVRGVGTNYDYGRNALEAQLFTVENRYEYLLSQNHVLEFGAGAQIQKIQDEVNEYGFIDSADYVQITNSTFNELSIQPNQYYGYIQSIIISKDSVHAFAPGVRLTHWNQNDEYLVSPRFSYRFAPKWEQHSTFKFSAGLYQQPPFYRELRDFTGQIRNSVKAQKSIHFIGGFTRLFYMWDRPFLFSADGYYKYLYDVIPYDVDNVRLRYYAENNATAFARGIDFRIHGEFVKGTQSWFSLGLLQTQEEIPGDGRGYIRRPMDQRINLAAYIEDHMPNDPSLRVYLNLVFGSGYPFGPPDTPSLRNAFSGDEYYRADVGLSKSFDVSINDLFNKLWIRLEVLNALAADNTLSYTWIEDVNGNHFAIPNSLSARFLNIKISAEL